MPTHTDPSTLIYNPSEPFRFSDYVDGVRIAAPYMKPLAVTLANARPVDLDETGMRQLERLLEIARHGDDVIDERLGLAGVRPLLVDFTDGWGGLHDGLEAKSRLPASLTDRGKRASALLERIFPDGVSFVQRDAYAAWSDGERRLVFISEQGLERELDELLGEEHLAATKAATAALGEALGVGSTRRDSLRGSGLQDTVARFSREVARYARMIAANVDLDDPVSVALFRTAVAEPIDALRSRRAVTEVGMDGKPVVPAPVVAPPAPPVAPA